MNIKSNILLFIIKIVILCMSLNNNVYAISNRISIIVGSNSSNQNWYWSEGMKAYADSDYNRNSNYYGLGIQFYINEKWSYNLNASYMKKGQDYSQTHIEADKYIQSGSIMDVEYLELPIYLRYCYRSIFFDFGPRMDILLDGSNFSYQINENELSPINVGLSFGTGLQLVNSIYGLINIGVKYNPDLNGMFKGTDVKMINTSYNWYIEFLSPEFSILK